MADAQASGACVRKDVGVQVPPRPPIAGRFGAAKPGYYSLRMAKTEDDARLSGRYELGEVIGRGGMGEVRAGTDLRLGRPVAVKLLRADLADDPEIRARFEAEARAAAQLAHPNVVAVYDTGEEDGQPFIVMERLPGVTLADEIEKRQLSPDRARHLGVQVLAALQVAHDAGIVHRDIKPGNVLATEGDDWKVADFGIAKSTEAAVDLTATGGLIGTPAYLAPERLEGRPATAASDIYSTGVVLYEALCGEKPFDADSPIAVAHMIREQDPVPLHTRCPDLDPAFAEAVERAMAKDPRRRFASAEEMHRALADDGASTVPFTPRPVEGTRSTRVLRSPPRPRPGVRAGWIAALVAAAVALVIVVVALNRDGSDDSPTAPQETTVTTDAAEDVGGGESTLPPPLVAALDRLEESVQP